MDVQKVADMHLDVIKEEISKRKHKVTIRGILSSEDPSALSYVKYTQSACVAAGINYELQVVDPDEVGQAIRDSNRDKEISGIFVYYPIFNDARDLELKDLVSHKKDIEGLSSYWNEKLADNKRRDVKDNKAILPCTALACLKAIAMTDVYGEGLPFGEKKVAIFNRSDVVGGPLARMMANDGAEVYSFDEHSCIIFKGKGESEASITPKDILKECDIVITGVPSDKFQLQAEDISEEAVCLNFAFVENFSEEAKEKSRIYIPKVGPLTIAMCLRNALRVYKNYQLEKANVQKSITK